MRLVLVFGNGLSIGFDPRLATRALTDRVVASLGADYTGIVMQLAELASPEVPDAAIGVDRGDFERLAGPLDRLAEALLAIERLLEGSDALILRGLREASGELRAQYWRIVGTVLREVDACCVQEPVTEERREAWVRLNFFAQRLVELSQVVRTTIFTINYDSLLISSLLEKSRYIYDGFRWGSLNLPLDRWQEPTLYHLHGSTGWITTHDGSVQKRRLEEVRAEGIIDGWAHGRTDAGKPTVVLGDLKTRFAQRYPFVVFYEELRRQLNSASLAVAGGYSFGDRPLNIALANFLSRSPRNRLVVWNPHGEAAEYLERLRSYVGAVADGILPDQVEHEKVRLPSAEVVDRLRERLLEPMEE